MTTINLNEPTTCVWTEDDDGNWESACGYAFIFNDAGPVDSDWKFCPKCGLPLAERSYVEPCGDCDPCVAGHPEQCTVSGPCRPITP